MMKCCALSFLLIMFGQACMAMYGGEVTNSFAVHCLKRTASILNMRGIEHDINAKDNGQIEAVGKFYERKKGEVSVSKFATDIDQALPRNDFDDEYHLAQPIFMKHSRQCRIVIECIV